MSARRLTGQALADVLGKAAEAAIGAAVERSADRLQSAITSVDEGLNVPSPPLRGRAGEGGGSAPPPDPDNRRSTPSTPHPDPPPQGGRGADRSQRVATKRTGASTTLTLSASNLFAHEFGSLAIPADPILAPAIARLKRRPR